MLREEITYDIPRPLPINEDDKWVLSAEKPDSYTIRLFRNALQCYILDGNSNPLSSMMSGHWDYVEITQQVQNALSLKADGVDMKVLLELSLDSDISALAMSPVTRRIRMEVERVCDEFPEVMTGLVQGKGSRRSKLLGCGTGPSQHLIDAMEKATQRSRSPSPSTEAQSQQDICPLAPRKRSSTSAAAIPQGRSATMEVNRRHRAVTVSQASDIMEPRIAES